MIEFYIQKVYFDSIRTNEHTTRGIFHTHFGDHKTLGSLGKYYWNLNAQPYNVMYKLKVKPM